MWRNQILFPKVLAAVRAGDERLPADLRLNGECTSQKYLAESECYALDGVDDYSDFKLNREALETIQVSDLEIENVRKEILFVRSLRPYWGQVWRVLALILHLGNITFDETSTEAAVCVEGESLAAAE